MTRDITVSVSDGDNGVANASVILTDESSNPYTGTTDENGEVTIGNVPDGSYSVSVTATGFADYTGTVTVDGDTSLSIVLDAVDTLTVIVDDGTDAIEGATVTIDGVEKTTDASGECTFADMVYDDYTASISATGFTSKTETLAFRSNHKSFTISLEAVDTITITVDDGESTPTPIEGATVVIDDITKTTDANGECTFPDMTYQDYSAEVSATGYITKTETIGFRSNHKSFTISLESA